MLYNKLYNFMRIILTIQQSKNLRYEKNGEILPSGVGLCTNVYL